MPKIRQREEMNKKNQNFFSVQQSSTHPAAVILFILLRNIFVWYLDSRSYKK